MWDIRCGVCEFKYLFAGSSEVVEIEHLSKILIFCIPVALLKKGGKSWPQDYL